MNLIGMDMSYRGSIEIVLRDIRKLLEIIEKQEDKTGTISINLKIDVYSPPTRIKS